MPATGRAPPAHLHANLPCISGETVHVMHQRAFPLFVLIGSQVAVGSAAILARYGLASGILPVPMAAWRLAIAAIVVVVAATTRRSAHPRPDHASAIRLVAAGILLGLHFVTWFASLQRISVAVSTLLVATCPLWTGLATRLFLRRKPRWHFWLGLAVAAAGMPLVCDAKTSTLTGGSYVPGALLATMSAVLISAYLIITQPDQVRLGTGTVVAWTYSSAAAPMWIAVALTAPGRAMPTTSTGWLAVIGLALVPQLLGHTAMNWSLRRFPVGVVGAATLLEPVVAAALAWWLLNEPITGWQALGGVVVLAGVGMVLGSAPPQSEKSTTSTT